MTKKINFEIKLDKLSFSNGVSVYQDETYDKDGEIFEDKGLWVDLEGREGVIALTELEETIALAKKLQTNLI